MRLTKLKIKGYRSIKGEETLIIDRRVTVLIGANDHGKSNLLSAIRCLNDDHPIMPDDRNWDLGSSDPVEIVWHFSPNAEVLRKLKDIFLEGGFTPSNLVTDPAGSPLPVAEVVPVVIGLVAGVSNPTPAVSKSTGSSQPEDAGDTKDFTFPTNGAQEIVFARDLATNKVRIVSLPSEVMTMHEKEILSLRPRVELFEPPTGSLRDQVTHAELETSAFEFMQGIFRLAGLWDSREAIFTQNTTTSKQLKEASERLTKILNDQWNQGKDLKWIFEHTGTNGDTIVIQIEDPAIKGRYTRPSLRSSGFRTYFLLSMIIYARSQNTPGNSHIYLFDEPGTYLHPAAQLDLQRSFEAIADQAQLAYTTHSLFLISKNYPVRNRVISKTIEGTKIDQKPFSKNWKAVRQSLGILLSNNFLIADKTLLVEGPSDAIYLLDALRKLKKAGEIDVDLNDISIVDAGDMQNFIAMTKIMLSEGRSLVALVDGDSGGKKIKTQLEQSCEAEVTSGKLRIHLLPENKSSEDVFADLDSLQVAVRKSFDKLVSDNLRKAKEGLNIVEAVLDIKSSDGTTLGKTIEKVTKLWFAPPDKVSKLLIAVLYEDEAESRQINVPELALGELQRITKLLESRGEKSERSGVLEEI